jgi:hypothetical protein
LKIYFFNFLNFDLLLIDFFVNYSMNLFNIISKFSIHINISKVLFDF